MARLAVLLGIACALAIAGCGSDSGPDGVQSAYENLEKQLIAGDADACNGMSGDYQNKLAASVQMFEADCPGVVKEVSRGFKDDPDLKTIRIEDVTVKGETATLVAVSKYNGKDVRTRAAFKRNDDGKWILDTDHELDEVGPSAPLSAYRAYTNAFNKGDGKAACALSTTRGQDLIIQSVPESHGGGTCAGAVPYIAKSTRQLPNADVVGGEDQGGETSLYTLQSNGNGSWIFRIVVMKNENGKWLFDYSRDLGTAPRKSLEGGPVA